MKKMNNTKMLRSFLAFVVAMTLALGIFSVDAQAATYTIKFDSNGGTPIEDQKVDSNGFIWRPEDPKKEGYIFVDWYTDKKFTKLFDFDAGATSNVTLYAKWIKIGKSQDFKKGNVYASGDTVNFGKDYVFINNGEKKLKN